MAKHAFTCLFFFIFMNFTMAQLTLQQVDGTKKHTIHLGNVIEMAFPIKTAESPKDAFHIYSGQLKNVSKTSIDMVLIHENSYFVNQYGVKIQVRKSIQPLDSPTITQMPLLQLQSITERYPKNVKVSNAGAFLTLLAVCSNLFIAPHLKAPDNKIVRNIGYVAMGVGLSGAFIKHRKTYNLEQPVNGHKRLWKIVY